LKRELAARGLLPEAETPLHCVILGGVCRSRRAYWLRKSGLRRIQTPAWSTAPVGFQAPPAHAARPHS
jgi:hypothetical protein